MAAQTGTVQTYGMTAGVMLDFEPLIQLLDAFDTPLLNGLGADGSTAIAQDTATEIKKSWQDEALLVPRSTLAATAVTADTVITVASGDRLRFQTDDLLLIGTETVRVTGLGTTADTLLVSRAFGGSAAQWATASAVVGIGSAPQEGADPQAARSIDRTERFNYTEIFGPYAVTVSGTENTVRKYGLVGTEFDHQTANRIREMAVALEQTILYGVRTIDTTNQRRSMGGMLQYITVNVDSTTTQLSESALLAELQTVFDAGGNPDRMVMGSKQARLFSAFTSAGTIFVQRADNVAGRVIDYYQSDFGRVTKILDRWARTADLFIFNRDQAAVCTLRPLHFEPLAKTGDAEKGMVLAEKTLRFARDRHAARFSALT